MPVPEQQAAIKRMRRLKDQGLALRAIADKMTAAGVPISHVGVKMPPPIGRRLPNKFPSPLGHRDVIAVACL